jgi:hypothetical protein
MEAFRIWPSSSIKRARFGKQLKRDLRGKSIATDKTFVSILLLASVHLFEMQNSEIGLDFLYIAGVDARSKNVAKPP